MGSSGPGYKEENMSRPVLLRRVPFALAALLAIAFVAAGCGGSSGGGGAKIALMLPENETPRYEINDRPDFEKAVEEQSGNCEFLYNNAGADAEKQKNQTKAAVTQRTEVLVVGRTD